MNYKKTEKKRKITNKNELKIYLMEKLNEIKVGEFCDNYKLGIKFEGKLKNRKKQIDFKFEILKEDKNEEIFKEIEQKSKNMNDVELGILGISIIFDLDISIDHYRICQKKYNFPLYDKYILPIKKKKIENVDLKLIFDKKK